MPAVIVPIVKTVFEVPDAALVVLPAAYASGGGRVAISPHRRGQGPGGAAVLGPPETRARAAMRIFMFEVGSGRRRS